eukprot:15366576-Ditylum_brightwellii.AAC.1
MKDDEIHGSMTYCSLQGKCEFSMCVAKPHQQIYTKVGNNQPSYMPALHHVPFDLGYRIQDRTSGGINKS